jgi:mycothiol synthase
VVESIAVVGTGGEAFARQVGASLGDELADAVLPLASVDPQLLRELATPPDGYALARWVGSAPAELVESYARAKGRIVDAPNHYPPAVPEWNADLVRAREQADARRRAALWVGVAVVAGTTSVVAFTEIEVGPAGEDASQYDTVVLPAHRRRGLATVVKADALLRLRVARPDVVSIGVTCAVANVGMRAVNYRLGFRETRRRTLYRLPLA